MAGRRMTEPAPDAPPGGVRAVTVAAGDAELRLDRWFKRYFPGLSHGRLEKLLRKGQIRVDGKRAKSGQRLAPGQVIRVPPMAATGPAASPGNREAASPVTPEDAEALRRAVLYRDEMAIAINKPPGLAVQGGTRTLRHLDGMLDALRDGAGERPRLVHRLDRDTSGVLILGRTAAAAALLARAFRQRSAQKLYWAVTVGTPVPHAGRIDLALAKGTIRGGERMMAAREADGGEGARKAVTLYRVVEHAGKEAALVALSPLTGRTHQLRVHLAGRGTPILGDAKYGGAGAFLPGRRSRLHLHARRLVLPIEGGPTLDIKAPPPPHMIETLEFFGFSMRDADALFIAAD
jgi:23S rRNA pseudouridine955/2504/2580 synthase